MEGVKDSETLCKKFFEALINKIGRNGTIVVPSFSYSFPQKKIFFPEHPVPEMGIFSNWIFGLSESYRSIDPCYSISAIGKLAKKLTINSPENSFDEKGFFGRFLKNNGVILNFNFDAGSTLIHFMTHQNQIFI